LIVLHHLATYGPMCGFAEPLAPGDHADEAVQQCRVAIAQREAIGLRRGEDAARRQFASESNGRASADGIQPIDVAQVPGIDDRLQVIHKQERPQRAQRLVFRPIHAAQAKARGACLAPAGDGAVEPVTSTALAPRRPYDMTVNDRRFLRALRIAAEEAKVEEIN
jgi:hypothetical protein